MTARGRYALYYAPAAASPWWHFGTRWLGRDEIHGEPVPQPVPDGFHPEAFHALTAEPRRYGFHATLKPPMRLLVDEARLLAQVDRLARSLHRCAIEPVPVYMDGFLALVPAGRDPALLALAAACVTELDGLRAPLTDEERRRRRPEALDDRGRELLDRWGYAQVLERFRFHLTLTGRCDAATAGRLVAQVAPAVAALQRAQPLVLDRLCVFHEPAPGADLRRIHEVELAA